MAALVRFVPTHNGHSFAPALDLRATAEAYLIEAVVSGLKPEDLNEPCSNVHSVEAEGDVVGHPRSPDLHEGHRIEH